jgi:hypothetical protein
VLRGPAQAHAVVLVSAACVSSTGTDEGSEPPLRVAVPSRTAIQLPGSAARRRRCGIDALVLSRAHTRVRTRLVRG